MNRNEFTNINYKFDFAHSGNTLILLPINGEKYLIRRLTVLKAHINHTCTDKLE